MNAPNATNRSNLHFPAGSLTDGEDPVALAPERAGWSYIGLRVLRLAAGAEHTLVTGADEVAVLPVSGSLLVEVEGRRFVLDGRDSVFARVSDWAYLPIDTEARLSSPRGCEVALASARATRRFEPAYVPAGGVPVEVRGAGPSTRQVTNFMAPDAFDGADRLMCVEVLTPDGNWSSYPPHRHDGSPGCPVHNDEIYYFRVGRTDASRETAYASEGFGFHRTYTPDGELDENLTVGDGDVFLIPRGYHGPCVAAPGYPLYYLNVLAGPGAERTMAFCDDPTYGWVRAAWETQRPDPRCPMTTAEGAAP
jgi:5-deoxy-glucuronate isomerase